MDLYLMTIISGLIAVLTPGVFPFLITTSFLFEKLESSIKQYKINVLIFSILTIIIYVFVISQMIQTNYLMELSNSSGFVLLIDSLQVIFLIWFFNTFFKKYQFLNNGFWKQFFRFFGLFIFSFRLVFASLSSTGPILGSILISNSSNENTAIFNGTLLGFSIGLIVPFIIVLFLLSKKYNKLRQKKWWENSQLIIAGILLLSSIIQLINII